MTPSAGSGTNENESEDEESDVLSDVGWTSAITLGALVPGVLVLGWYVGRATVRFIQRWDARWEQEREQEYQDLREQLKQNLAAQRECDARPSEVVHRSITMTDAEFQDFLVEFRNAWDRPVGGAQHVKRDKPAE